jgi:hypothetical protein
MKRRKPRKPKTGARVWPGATNASTKRQQYKWRQLIGRVDAQGLNEHERQKRLDEGYRKIFMGGR